MITDAVADAGAATVNATSAPANETDNCEVCLVAQREPRLVLVPCGHQRFCESCIRHLESIGSPCPICRADISIVFRLFQHLTFDMYCISAVVAYYIIFVIEYTYHIMFLSTLYLSI